jgi:hypothetical protein
MSFMKNEIMHLFFMLLSELDKILYRKFLLNLFSTCEFLENRYTERNALLIGIT